LIKDFKVLGSGASGTVDFKEVSVVLRTGVVPLLVLSDLTGVVPRLDGRALGLVCISSGWEDFIEEPVERIGVVPLLVFNDLTGVVPRLDGTPLGFDCVCSGGVDFNEVPVVGAGVVLLLKDLTGVVPRLVVTEKFRSGDTPLLAVKSLKSLTGVLDRLKLNPIDAITIVDILSVLEYIGHSLHSQRNSLPLSL